MGRESLRNFDDCYICLHQARDPVSWYLVYPILGSNWHDSTKGHIACRECVYEHLLKQKQQAQEALQRQQRQQQQLNADIGSRKLIVQGELCVDFEKTQKGLESDLTLSQTMLKVPDQGEDGVFSLGKKRVLQLEEESLRMAEQHQLQEGQLKKKVKLPSFWLVSRFF